MTYQTQAREALIENFEKGEELEMDKDDIMLKPRREDELQDDVDISIQDGALFQFEARVNFEDIPDALCDVVNGIVWYNTNGEWNVELFSNYQSRVPDSEVESSTAEDAVVSAFGNEFEDIIPENVHIEEYMEMFASGDFDVGNEDKFYKYEATLTADGIPSEFLTTVSGYVFKDSDNAWVVTEQFEVIPQTKFHHLE